MKVPAFIKQLAAFCDPSSSRYALGGIKCSSDGITAQLTATDGRILANVYYPDDDTPKFDVIVDAKQLSSIPAAAHKSKSESGKPHFDGKTLRYGDTTTTPSLIDGRFPRYEDVFSIHDKPEGYTVVKLDASYLRTLCDLASVVGGQANKGVTLFVKDAQSAVFGYATSAEGHTARLVIMPLAADDGGETPTFPPRPGEQPVEAPAPKPKAKREMRAKYETVYADGRREPGPTVNVTTGVVEEPAPTKTCAAVIDVARKTVTSVDSIPAPPPEVLEDDAIAAAVTREPESFSEMAAACGPL